MILSELSVPALAERLRHGDIAMRCGPFVVRVASPVPAVAHGLALLYADYPLTDAFADFHLELAPPASLRRWFRPQVVFTTAGERPFEPFPADQAYPLFEWSLNWCIASTAHQFLISHAAIVEQGGRALILPGLPGAGKSTLTAALVNRGWRLFSDELTLVDLDSRRMVPLPRPVSLKNESIDIIRTFAPEAIFNATTHNTFKGAVCHMRVATDHVRRAHETAAAGWIVFPHYEAGAESALTPRSKPDTLLELARNTFNYGILGRGGFNALCDVVEASACFDFRYGRLEEAVVLFDRLSADGVR